MIRVLHTTLAPCVAPNAVRYGRIGDGDLLARQNYCLGVAEARTGVILRAPPPRCQGTYIHTSRAQSERMSAS